MFFRSFFVVVFCAYTQCLLNKLFFISSITTKLSVCVSVSFSVTFTRLNFEGLLNT